MNIAFQSPALLWLLPLAAAPVVFHLFFRVRARKRAFPSLLFFLAANPRMGARRKLREWLTLALRCLALLCIFLALPRPMLRGAGGASPILLVMIDNSASMAAAPPAGESRLDRAVAGATALLSDKAIRSAAVATTVPDPAATFPDSLLDDTSPLRATLASLSPTDASGDPAAAFARLSAAAGRDTSHACEAHVFTDLQSADWLRAGDNAPTLPAGTEIFIHDVARAEDRAGTVAIAAISPPFRDPVAGRAWNASIELVNRGPRAADVLVDSAIGDSTPERMTVSIPANSRKTVTSRFAGGPAGLARAHVTLGGQDAAPGSEAWFAVEAIPAATAWLAGGARMHGMLSPALSPDGPGALTGLATREIDTGDLPSILAADTVPSVVAMTPRQLAANSREAQSWLARGGTVIVAPQSGAAAPEPVSIEAFGLSFMPVQGEENGAPLSALSTGDRFWRELRDESGDVTIRDALAFRWQAVEAPQGVPATGGNAFTPLLAVAKNGAPQNVLVRIDVGKGRIFACGMPWDMRSGTLPRRAAFLAMVQAMAHSADSDGPADIVAAGEPVSTDGAAILRFRSLAGPQENWLGAPDAVPPPPRAGLYELRRDNEEPEILSVRGDDSEADPALAKAGDLPIFRKSNPHLLKYANATATLRGVAAARSGRPLFAMLAVAACVFLAAETIVANRFG